MIVNKNNDSNYKFLPSNNSCVYYSYNRDGLNNYDYGNFGGGTSVASTVDTNTTVGTQFRYSLYDAVGTEEQNETYRHSHYRTFRLSYPTTNNAIASYWTITLQQQKQGNGMSQTEIKPKPCYKARLQLRCESNDNNQPPPNKVNTEIDNVGNQSSDNVGHRSYYCPTVRLWRSKADNTDIYTMPSSNHETSMMCRPAFLLFIVVVLVLVIFLLISGIISYYQNTHHKSRPLVIRVLDSEPCDKTYCAWGAECIAGPDRRPHCQCPSFCPEFNLNDTDSNTEHRLIPVEVCGTDGVTYSSQCHLRKSSCQRKVNIRVQHSGACEQSNSSESSHDTTTTMEIALNTEQDNTNAYALTSLVLPIPTTLEFNNQTNETEITDPCRGKQCEYGARCVASTDGRTASCQCPKQCPSYGDHTASRPVCGSNGNDYKDKCELRKHACATNTEITVKFEGKCDPCSEISCPEPEICQLDKDRSPVCRCSDTCSLEFTPVCGSDGKTYSNECTLKQEACRTRKQLRIIYRGKCSSGTNPCASVHCTLGEECTINKYGIARCECPPDCEPIMRPVCSKDGRTFPSECEMRRAACSSRTKIEIAYTGICDKMGPCSDHHCRYGAQCIERDGTALCECPTCPTEFQPVCGSDGISYSNECKLRLEACNHKRDISVLYDGPCNGCENKKCEFYSTCETDGSSEAQCMCPKPCKNQESDPVCGSDKNTYENECELKITSCQTKQLITVAYRGSCDLCKNVECKFGAHCKAGECVCPTDCSSSGVENVCASNMVTFTNECELKKASCLLPPEASPLNVIFYGDCRERFAIMDPLALTTPSSMLNNARFGIKQDLQIIEDISNGIVDIESKKHEACRDIHCDFEATCELGPDNFPRCSCRFDCTSAEVLSSNKPVCASDLRIYPSLCAMKMEACQRQEELRLRPLDLCQGMEVKPCNGEMPLIDPVSRIELDCGSGPNRQDCPSGSYCHQTTRFARCCQKKGSIYENSCEDSWYGCCPDGKTPAQGPEHAGCPSQCNCHRLGSFDDTCDPDTGQCHCRPGVGGLKCDRCEPGYWGLPKISSGHRGCLPCGCSTFGSVRDDCEQMTGRCVCKPDIQGQKCTVCTSHDKVLGPNGCIAVDHTTPPPSTCKELNCHFGAICTDRKGLAICECHSECANETPGSKVVCGSDGQTYGSECQLKLVACRHQKDIVVYAFGPCKDEMFPGTDWPIGRYTPQEFTQPDEQHSILSKSTRHLMMPDSRYYYSRASHDSSSTDKWEHKESKETNFITDINFNGHAAYRPTPATVRVLTALLGDICTNNSDCAIPNSICIGGACTCEEGFVETLDRQECLAHSIPITTEEFRACTSSPCHGDSTCIDLPSATFTCVCNSNYTGMLCEQEISVKYYDVPSFDGNSHMRLKTVRAYHKLNMEIEFKSYNTEGIIFYNQQKVDGTGDFFSLAIINGYVEFRYNLGNGVVKIVSLETIAPLKYHRITLKRYQKDGMLKLDDGEDVTGQSPGKLRALDLEDNAYMGGIPSNHSRIFKNIGTSKWFVGCIRKLKINHKIIDMHLGQDETVISADRVQECGSNPCLSGPCLNGGTCNTINAQQYACMCPESFEGHVCESPVNGCNFFPCKHGSTCEPLANGKFHCKCIPGTYGFTCEEIETTSANLIVPEFNGTTFLEYSKILSAGKTFSIEIWFLSYAPNGLLLYTGQHKTGSGDFVSLNLANQHVQFRFNLGSGICNITSKETVTLNKWYQLRVHRRERDGSLQLNNGTIIFGRSGPPLTELNLELPVYIAAVPNSSEVHRLSGVSKGLRGAIQHLSINGKEYPILKEKSLCVPDLRYTNYNCRRIKLRKYKGLPCSESRNPCKNGGTCIPMLNDYVCQCKDTFGNHCETVGDNFKYSIKFDGGTFLQYRNRRMRLTNTTNVFSEDENYSDLVDEDVEDYDLEGDLLPQYESYENLEDDDKYFDTIGKRGGERGNNYEISFRTFETDSLLMWRSKTRSLNNHYLAIAIVGGYPEFSFNLGKKLDFWSIRFPKQVNDGAWHTVHVRRQKRVGFISVDGEDAVKGISWPGAITFNAHPRLWIGGYSALPHGLPQSYYSGFRGCIQYVKVNKRSLDLLKDKSFRPQFCHENEV